jgi:hypothetical protein
LKKLQELFTQIINATEVETKRKSVREAKRYILGNWEGIRNQYEPDYHGCSAEGHVSHILSSRLSSRPLGWSKTGVDQMARLRAFAANGGVVYDFLLEKKRAERKEARISRLKQEIIEKRKAAGSYETMGNLVAYHIGDQTSQQHTVHDPGLEMSLSGPDFIDMQPAEISGYSSKNI